MQKSPSKNGTPDLAERYRRGQEVIGAINRAVQIKLTWGMWNPNGTMSRNTLYRIRRKAVDAYTAEHGLLPAVVRAYLKLAEALDEIESCTDADTVAKILAAGLANEEVLALANMNHPDIRLEVEKWTGGANGRLRS